MAPTYNPVIQARRQEDDKLKTSVDYMGDRGQTELCKDAMSEVTGMWACLIGKKERGV